MLEKVIKVYKKTGQTPLDCILNLKDKNNMLISLPMTYAGRLDPLAEGLLLILAGDECHNKEKYLKLNKEYEIEILFGFSTDTYDVMGKIVSNKNFTNITSDLISDIKRILPGYIGNKSEKYPPYSSKTVKGKPLFIWAREGRLNEIEIPSHDVLVNKIEILEISSIKADTLLFNIKEKISKVRGDFRQDEIISIWSDELINKNTEKYQIVKLRISCGSGVYMRSIANDIGKKIKIPALALKIVRTKVGNYRI